MSRKGRKFEKAYEWLYSLDNRFTVTSPAYLYDKASEGMREVDVLVEYTDAEGLPRKICIECRDRGKSQDVMWIEQLQQKREDLGLDYIVATTTSAFTAGAIRKAKYHGIIIEQAELLSKKTLEDAAEFFLDIFLFKFTLLEMYLYTESNEILSLKSYLNCLNVFEQHALLKDINGELYFSIDPSQIIQEHGIKTADFFSKNDSSIEIGGTRILNLTERPLHFKNIKAISWKIRIIPHRITLPLVDSVSVFDGETHANKDYRAIYGNEDEYFKIGYLDGKLFTELNLTPRKYLRIASGNISLNTIIPDSTDLSSAIDMEYIEKNWQGEFDMSRMGL